MPDDIVVESTVVEESEFDSAFAEHAAKREDPPEPDSIDESDPSEEADAAPVGVAPAPIADDAPDEVDDKYKDLPEATREHLVALEKANKDLTHRLDSDAGRVSAFQRKVNLLETEIQDIRSGPVPGAQPSDNEIADAMKGTDEEWDQFTEDYPAVASAIDRRLEAAGIGIQESVNKTLAPVAEQQKTIVRNELQVVHQSRIDEVAQIYPKWTDATGTPEFSTWLDEQPPGIQALSRSDDTKDASSLIGMYDSHLVANGRPTLKADPTEPGVTGAAPAGSQEQTDLEKRRTQQLEAGTTIPSKPAGIDPQAASGDEFEQAFAFHANRKDRARQTA